MARRNRDEIGVGQRGQQAKRSGGWMLRTGVGEKSLRTEQLKERDTRSAVRGELREAADEPDGKMK